MMQQHLCTCCQEVWINPSFNYCPDCLNKIKSNDTPQQKLEKKVNKLEKAISVLQKRIYVLEGLVNVTKD